MIQLLLAGAVALVVSLFGTRILVEVLRARRVGQPISEHTGQHVVKAGTPSMGGVAIVGAAVCGYLAAHVRPGLVFTTSGLSVMAAILGATAVGFADDWLKVVRAHNVGLTKGTKILGLLGVGIGFAILAVGWAGVNTSLSFTRADQLGVDLGPLGWSIWAMVLILGAANAVNLTDGLDGLAAGSGIMSFGAFVIIAFWAFRHPGVYDVPHALDLAVIAAALLGGCAGFLWWNANPAQIFMGDTGALAIGTALACLALMTGTSLLLPLLGLLYVIETMSVILQVISFRVFGRRIFRMSPLHHHFELLGWPEATVIVRFWVLAGLFTALALGVFYADFLSTGAIE